MGALNKGGIRREDLERRVVTAERLMRVETVQSGMSADVGEIKDAVLELGKAVSSHVGKETKFQEDIKDALLEIKTDIKLIHARHRALKRKVAIMGAAVGAIVTGATHYAADLWHLIFPSSGAK